MDANIVKVKLTMQKLAKGFHELNRGGTNPHITSIPVLGQMQLSTLWLIRVIKELILQVFWADLHR